MPRRRSQTTSLALGPFVAALDDRLAVMSAGELRAAIQALAHTLAPTERGPFLDQFGAAGLPPPDEATALLEAVDVLEEEAGETGEPEWSEYDEWTDRYGWTGDEEMPEPPWAPGLLALLERVGTLFLVGDYATAAAAYERLLRVAAEVLDEGWSISSDPADDETVAEAISRYLRALYHVTAPRERPARLRTAVTALESVIAPGDLSLAAVAGAAPEPLDELNTFLADWIAALTPLADDSSAVGFWAHEVLLEGIAELEGPAGLARLARSAGRRSGEAYLAWVDAARRTGDLHGATEAAREGIDALSPGWQRAAVAERLAVLADNAGDDTAAVDAWIEAWRSAPTLDRLLALVLMARRAGTAAEVVAALAKKPSAARVSVKVTLHVLAGELDSAVKAAGHAGRGEADALLVPALLTAGTDATRDDRFNGSVLAQLLESADAVIELGDRFSFSHDVDRPPLPDHDLTVGQLLVEALGGVSLSSKQRRTLFDTGIDAAAAAVARIVEAKDRLRYSAAATYAIAHAEAVALVHGSASGDGVADDAAARYPRHTAYRAELITARRRSQLLSSPPRRR